MWHFLEAAATVVVIAAVVIGVLYGLICLAFSSPNSRR